MGCLKFLIFLGWMEDAGPEPPYGEKIRVPPLGSNDHYLTLLRLVSLWALCLFISLTCFCGDDLADWLWSFIVTLAALVSVTALISVSDGLDLLLTCEGSGSTTNTLPSLPVGSIMIIVFKIIFCGGILSDIHQKSSFKATLMCRRKTWFPTVYPTIYLPKWKIVLSLSECTRNIFPSKRLWKCSIFCFVRGFMYQSTAMVM